MPEDALQFERRHHERHLAILDCKLRTRDVPGFAPGQTTNLSLCGALLRLPADRAFAPGDRVDLALAGSDRGIVASDDLIRARIRRVIPIDHHHQALGLEFDAALESESLLAA